MHGRGRALRRLALREHEHDGQRGRRAGGDFLLQAGHANLEKFVEIAVDDAQEAQAFQRGHAAVLVRGAAQQRQQRARGARAAHEYPDSASIYSRQKNPVLDRLFVHGRRRFGDPLLLSRQDGMRGIVKALREGRMDEPQVREIEDRSLSEKVAVTVNAALVGLGALVESATVGTVPPGGMTSVAAPNAPPGMRSTETPLAASSPATAEATASPSPPQAPWSSTVTMPRVSAAAWSNVFVSTGFRE